MKRTVRRVVLAGGLSLVLVAGAVAVGAARTSSQFAGLRGTFSLLAMVHTTQYQGQDLQTRATVPWDGSSTPGGPFVYAAIPCTGDAPVNNLSTDLTTYNGRLPGSRSPASTRSHPLTFDVVRNRKGRLRLRGTVTLTVCQLKSGPTSDPDPIPDAQKDKIFVRWGARFSKTSPEEVRWIGRFSLAGGTGIYENLTGEGRIAGYFFCFAPGGCASLGEFRDGQYTMSGTWADPTV